MAIGTGGKRYAKAFIEDESVPFEVLLDEEGLAAEVVGTGTASNLSFLSPTQILAGARSLMKGNRQHNLGRRPYQLGATLVIAPGDRLLYEDFEDYAGDHADLNQVLKALN